MNPVLMNSRMDEVSTVDEMRQPQMSYLEAQQELLRVVTDIGAKIEVQAKSTATVGKPQWRKPENTVEINVTVRNSPIKSELKTSTQDGPGGKLVIYIRGDEYFHVQASGTLMNDAVHAIKRAYLNWKGKE